MRSIEYPKTENLLVRDPDTHLMQRDTFRVPEHALKGADLDSAV